MDTSTMSVMYLVAVILAIVLLVCWIVLPFAVIGTKPLLRDLLHEQRRTNELLTKQLALGQTPAPAHQPPPGPGRQT